MKKPGRTLVATLTVTFFFCCQPAAGEKPAFGDTFLFNIGGMENYANAEFSSTRDDRPEVDLDMDKLGMDPKARTIWVGFTWQYAEKWGLSVSYSGFSSDGEVVASEGGNFGDIAWNLDARLNSELDLDLYIVDLHWTFFSNERSHLGAGVGLHVADLSASIGAVIEADLNGVPLDPPVDLGSETAAITAPLPNVFVRGGHRFGESFYLGATLGYFALEVDDIGGDLLTARTILEWRPGAGDLGLGLGYQYVRMNVDDTGGSTVKKYDTEFYGPALFLSVGF